MLFQLAQKIRCKIPALWHSIEYANEFLFSLRYYRTLKQLNKVQISDSGFVFRLLRPEDSDSLCNFFSRQPKQAFEFFKPHKFDSDTLSKLLSNRAFIAVGTFDNTKIIGYAFIRCFFTGKAFRGKIVDFQYRGKGIAKDMCLVITEISELLHLKQYGTISRKNLASMNSSKAVNYIEVVKELENDNLLIRYLPITQQTKYLN
ncbi:MAG: transcriptional regulator [Bacteroidales bacterium]|nr:transcriptional regulator [Bacteroidales bacterium]